MQEFDINKLIDKNSYLKENIPDNIIIIGEIKELYIKYKYNQLDLSKIECIKINFYDQEGEDIKNHILPKSLKELYCGYNKITILPYLPKSLKELYCGYNKITILPYLPNSLEYLFCNFNKLTKLPQLPNSLIKLNCYNNRLTSLPDLPNSLIKLNCYNNRLTSLPELPISLTILDCENNQLTSLPNLQNSLKYLDCCNNNLTFLPDLPNSLKVLYCDYNQLTTLPDFSHIDHKLTLSFIQDTKISYISYNKNLKLCNKKNIKIIIEDYPHNPIINQQDLDRYMKYIKNYQLNRIKSARK